MKNLNSTQRSYIADWIENHEILIDIDKMFISEKGFFRHITIKEYGKLLINTLCEDIRKEGLRD